MPYVDPRDETTVKATLSGCGGCLVFFFIVIPLALLVIRGTWWVWQHLWGWLLTAW